MLNRNTDNDTLPCVMRPWGSSDAAEPSMLVLYAANALTSAGVSVALMRCPSNRNLHSRESQKQVRSKAYIG